MDSLVAFIHLQFTKYFFFPLGGVISGVCVCVHCACVHLHMCLRVCMCLCMHACLCVYAVCSIISISITFFTSTVSGEAPTKAGTSMFII